MEMLGLTRTPAMATLFLNKPECGMYEGKHRLLSPDVFLWLSLPTTFRLKAPSAKHHG